MEKALSQMVHAFACVCVCVLGSIPALKKAHAHEKFSRKFPIHIVCLLGLPDGEFVFIVLDKKRQQQKKQKKKTNK